MNVLGKVVNAKVVEVVNESKYYTNKLRNEQAQPKKQNQKITAKEQLGRLDLSFDQQWRLNHIIALETIFHFISLKKH